MNKRKNITEKVLSLAKARGIIRVRDLMEQGIHPEYLRRLCEKGLLMKMGRGVYIPADSEISPNVGLAQAAKRVPHGVVCLLSALQFHNLGTQSPPALITHLCG
jgi:predicted transcriptional regulator of viral defense system